MVRLLAAASFLLLTALAGCSDDVGASAEVGIHGFAYDPAQVSVAAKGSVLFVNHESTVHTVTANDGSFDSGDMGEGEEFRTPKLAAGTHAYHCAKHASMRGTIVVT